MMHRVREPNDLVLNGRAVPGTSTGYLPPVHGRRVQRTLDDLPDRLSRPRQPAIHLARAIRGSVVTESEFGPLPFLPLQPSVVHRPPIDPWRRARLESLDAQAERVELLGKIN